MCPFLLYLLNCCSFCHHTWFVSTTSEAWVFCGKKNAFKVKVTVKVQNISECLSGWYLLNCRTFCYQTWYCDASSWAMSRKKIGFLFSRSSLQPGLMWSKYDSFYYIFWTADPFATKLGLMAHHHKLDCQVKRLDCYFQGQGHSKGSYDQNMTVSFYYFLWTIDSSATKLCLMIHHLKP